MFCLATFGGLSLANRVASNVTISRRRLAVLALLAQAGDRGLTRDKLVAYLWPESASEDARHSLEQVLYSLRRQLGADAFLGTDPLRLNTDIVASDVATFEDALERGADEEAVAVYRGDFLDGFYLKGADEFGRWADDERSRLSAAYGAALERLAAKAADRNDWPAAVDAWRRLVALDRLSAKNTLGLVRSLAAAGDRPEALRTAAGYETLVQHELGIPLEPSIAVFVQTLRSANGRIVGAASEGDAVQLAPVAPPSPLPGRADGTVSRVSSPTPGRRFAIAALVAALAVTLGVQWWTRSAPVIALPRIVVLVFENRTADSTLDTVGVTTADYTSLALHRTGLFDVDVGAFDLWRPENARAANRSSIETIVRQTRATLVVRGFYYKSGDSLLFAGEGVDTKSGRIIFAFDSVKTSVRDRLQAGELVRQRVTSGIASRIDPALTPWAGHDGKPPIRLDAYQEFADGMTSFVSGIAQQSDTSRGEAAFASARVHLERAFRLDSTYHIAALWWFWSRYNVGDLSGADSVLRILEPRRRAMSRYERALYDYNVALMHGTPEQRYQLDKQLVEFAPASEFRFCLTRDALEAGRPTEALAMLATLDDSYSWLRLMRPPAGFRVRGLVQQGEYARAVDAAHRIHADAPDDLTSAYPEIDALAALGRLEQIEPLIDAFDRRAGVNKLKLANLQLYGGLRLQSEGRRARAQRLFTQAWVAYTDVRASGISPDAILFGRARSLYYLEHWDSSRVVFEQLARAPLGSSPYDRRAMVFLGSLAARRGDSAEVARLRHALRDSVVNPAFLQYFESRVAVMRGQHDLALRFLGTAVSFGAQAEHLVMDGDAAPSIDPDFRGLRGSAAFSAAVGRW